MRRTWVKVIIALMTMVLMMGASAAWAGMFPDQDVKIMAARARGLEADRRAAAEKTVIVLKYAQQQRDLERIADVRAAAVTKPAVSDDVVPAGKAFRRFLTTVVGFPFHFVGAGINGFGTGVTSPTSSLLEYLLIPSFCRGVNTAFDQVAEFTVMAAYDTVNYGNAFDKVNRADPANLGYVASRTIKWGPLAQTFRTGGSAAAPACAAAGVLAPAAGMCYGGTVATLATANTAGGYAVGKAGDMAEKKLLK